VIRSFLSLLLCVGLTFGLGGCVTTSLPMAAASPWSSQKLGIESNPLDVASFRCPVCRSPVAAFRDIGPRDKPSGFEENLKFGLGVNVLTPGQKNVLIFGGFALAFAFFLSLYSLR
jgi:hypothetical protein